jgi:signal transduction histidine kinase
LELEKELSKELENSPILKALVCSMPEYIIIFDLKGKIVSINGRMREFIKETPSLSFTTGEEKAPNLCEMNLLDNRCHFLKACSGCMFEKLISEVRDKKEPIFNREGFLNFSIGGLTERISIILNVYPFEYKEEEYIIFSFRDIENIREYERKRIEDMHKLSLIGESVASIVHDLKNPLTGLYGYLELMKIKENKEELISKMEGSLEVIRTTLEDVLGLTTEGESITLEKTNEDVLEMIKDIVRLLRVEDITEIYTEGNLYANIDKMKFHNVFWNIIKNANESLNDLDDKIKISIIEIEDMLEIVVEDNGKGIAEENKKEIFKPGKTFGKHNGTGFGLVNAKRIVEAHKGQIYFESEEGKGTKFFIVIKKD